MNKNSHLYLLLAFFMPFIASCSHDSGQRQLALDNISAPYAEGAVNIQLTAEPGLNSWKEMSNSVQVLVIQGGNKSQLEEVLKNKSELHALFNGASANDKVLKVDRYMLMPGQQHTLHIDRAENVRQVAVVAGYYPSPGEGHITRFAVPETAHKKNWWSSEWDAQLAPLQVSLTLGKSRIVSISGADNLYKPASESQEAK